MSSFRAINQPSEDSLESSPRERSTPDVVSRQSRKTDGGRTLASSPKQAAWATRKADKVEEQRCLQVILPPQKSQTSPKKRPIQRCQPCTAQPSAPVIPHDKQSGCQSKNKDSIGQAVAKAKRAKLSPKQKCISGQSTSKVRRQQASREKKLMPSIEHSVWKRTASSTPDIDDARESDYIPSRAESAHISMSSASSPVCRRSPRKHASLCPKNGSSTVPGSLFLGIGGTPAASNKEVITVAHQSPRNLKAAVMPRPPSPALWNSQLRHKKYKEAEFVELPKEVFEYEKAKKEAKKEMRQKLALKKEIMLAGKRKVRGNFFERRSVQETYESTPNTDKRRVEDEMEQNKPRKRHKLQKTGLEEILSTNDSKVVSEAPQISQQSSARGSPKGMTTGWQAQRYEAVIMKIEDRLDISDVRSQRSGQAGGQTSRDRGQQKRTFNEGWRKAYQRREVSVLETFRPCSCSMLPDYFTTDPSFVPCWATWPGGELEFFEHVKQICSCKGSIHPQPVVDACRRMLRERDNAKRCSNDLLESSVLEGHNDDNLRRAQSSIPPPAFYGSESGYQPSLNSGSSPRFAQPNDDKPRSLGSCFGLEKLPPPKEAPIRTTPARTLVVNGGVKTTTNSSSAMVDDASGCSTLPNSLPLGNRRGVNKTSHRISDTIPNEKENDAVMRISKGLPDALMGRPETQASFNSQRHRHQSVPIDLYRKNTDVNESDSSPHSPQRRRESALCDVSHNVLLRKVTNCEVLLDRLGARLHTQSTVVQPESTGPAATGASQGENRVGQSRVRKKRPSRAERQLKKPVLDRNVPVHLQLSDEEIIEVGRIVNPYERHVKARQAFAWDGRLYSDYKALLTRQSNGVPVWTADEINRMR